jgi:hypothetical protein
LKDLEPRRCNKEILGLLNFPKKFMEDLEKCCVPWNKQQRDDPEKRYVELSRLEDYILKPIIPFIRIGHLPRGRYFQLKGDLIMVSANVIDTLQRILPVDQNLIPVSLKRRMQYSGHYMQEYVDRYKIKQYFLWFQRHNHIFHNMELNETLIDKFEEESRKITEREDIAKVVIITDHDEIKKKVINDGGSDSEEEVEEETIKLEKENVLSDHSSFITDKYLELLPTNFLI